MVDFHTSLDAALARPVVEMTQERLVAVLNEHLGCLAIPYDRETHFMCGAIVPSHGGTYATRRAHVAAALAVEVEAVAYAAWVRGQYAGRDYERRLARWARLLETGPKPDAPTNPYEARPV